MRIILAAIIGGIIMFAWEAVAHMALPIGEMGISKMTTEQEQIVLPALDQAITEPGFYGFPSIAMSMEKTDVDAYSAADPGPIGIMVVEPKSKWSMTPRAFITEFAANVLAALLVAIIATQLASGYGMRVFLIALIGATAWLSINASEWNWYKFPTDMFIGNGIDQIVGWFLSGLAIAAIVPRPGHKAATA